VLHGPFLWFGGQARGELLGNDLKGKPLAG